MKRYMAILIGAILFSAGSLLAMVICLSVAAPCFAQDPLELEAKATKPGGEDWSLAVTPYVWFAAQSSDVGGQALRQSFNDLASITNFGFQGRLLARWRWLMFAADYTYADQESNTKIWQTAIDMKLKQHILDMKIGGKVYDSRTAAQDGGMAIWVGAGARYWDNKVDFTMTREPIIPGDPVVETEETGQSYWDPVLGLNFHFPVTPKVGFLAKGTGGGFGIGNASDYMWDVELGALFRVHKRLMISAGYRQFKYDRTDGSGDDEIRQTVTVIGPAIGLSIGLF